MIYAVISTACLSLFGISYLISKKRTKTESQQLEDMSTEDMAKVLMDAFNTMNKREQLQEIYYDIELHFSDSMFDDAIMSIDMDTFNSEPRVVYSIEKCIDILFEEYKSSDDYETEEEAYDAATEMLYFNYIGAYLGETSPMWLSFDLFE